MGECVIYMLEKLENQPPHIKKACSPEGLECAGDMRR